MAQSPEHGMLQQTQAPKPLHGSCVVLRALCEPETLTQTVWAVLCVCVFACACVLCCVLCCVQAPDRHSSATLSSVPMSHNRPFSHSNKRGAKVSVPPAGASLLCAPPPLCQPAALAPSVVPAPPPVCLTVRGVRGARGARGAARGAAHWGRVQRAAVRVLLPAIVPWRHHARTVLTLPCFVLCGVCVFGDVSRTSTRCPGPAWCRPTTPTPAAAALPRAANRRPLRTASVGLAPP